MEVARLQALAGGKPDDSWEPVNSVALTVHKLAAGEVAGRPAKGVFLVIYRLSE